MSEAKPKHTPGPWTIKTQDIGDEEFIWVPGEVLGPNREVIVSTEGGLYPWDDRVPGQYEADARLIAAAPDLLEACKAYIELFRSSDMSPEDECHHIYRLVAAAVDKAEGGVK